MYNIHVILPSEIHGRLKLPDLCSQAGACDKCRLMDYEQSHTVFIKHHKKVKFKNHTFIEEEHGYFL